MTIMILLHAGAYEGGIAVWGEESYDDHADSTALPWWKSVRTSQAKKHPLGASFETLTRALKTALPLDSKTATTTTDGKCTVSVWLPTQGSYPVPSSDVIAEPLPPSKTRTKMAAWGVDAYKLSPKEAVNLLCLAADRRTVAPGVLVGADMAYWTDVLRFAGFLVARQQFLPDLEEDKDAKRYVAKWNPVFLGRDSERFDMLARRMPAVARALSRHSVRKAPDRPATAVLKCIVAMFTDHMVRMAAPPPTLQSVSLRHLRAKFDSIHDSWLYGLKSKDGIVHGDSSHLAELAIQIHDWQRAITVSTTSPFRLCFRLEEPADDAGAGGTWFVRYLLQALDDLSLIVSAAEVWDGRAAAILEKSGPNAKEFLLFSLGQASGICKDVATGLKDTKLEGHALDASGAYEFLTAEAVSLEQAGYGIMLPSWWTSKIARAKLAARVSVQTPRMNGYGGMSMAAILKFNWEVALGGQKITLEELEKIAEMKSSLVKVRGQWMDVNASEIQSAIKFLKKGKGKAQFRDVVRMALGAEEAPGGLEINGVNSTGKLAEILGQLDGTTRIEDLPQPVGFTGTLRPYQVRGYSWLSFLRRWGLGGCLADDMGLGKTIQTLALIQRDWKADDDSHHPVLLICPTSVVDNWHREATRFAPELPVMIHHGAGRIRGNKFKKTAEKHAIVVSSYGLVKRDADMFEKVDWGGVVLDEAQNIKNPETKQARAIRALDAEYRLALTGTPVENNVGDLWSIMEFLNPGFLGTREEFRRKFFVPIQANQDADAARRLKRATEPFILRRLKTDKSIISDLPEKMEAKVFCPLTEEQASLYTSVLDECMKDLDASEGIQRKGVILSTILKLKQVCNHPAQFLSDGSAIAGRSGKLDRLTEMLEEVVESGDRALVFSQFAGMGYMLKRYLQETFGLEVLFLHGGVSRGQRVRMVERFQNDKDGPQIFVLSLKAGGTGLNLTAASHVFHFDRWWNPAVEDQATDRIFRIGQKRNVQVHKFVCAGTLEEKIDAMIKRKVKVARMVVGTGEKWITELSDDDLKDMLSLGGVEIKEEKQEKTKKKEEKVKKKKKKKEEKTL